MAHDDLKEIFSGFRRELLDAHIVDDKQVAFEVSLERLGVVLKFQCEQLSDHVEDRTIEDGFAALDQFVTEDLGQVTFTHARWADEEQVVLFLKEVPGGEFGDLGSVDFVEAEVEALQAALITESPGFQHGSFEVIRTQAPRHVEVSCRRPGIVPSLLDPWWKLHEKTPSSQRDHGSLD